MTREYEEPEESCFGKNRMLEQRAAARGTGVPDGGGSLDGWQMDSWEFRSLSRSLEKASP